MGEALRKEQGQWFSTDRPIERRADDRLGRRGFAEAIAAAIRGWRGRDSLVIALYGVWGTGKSSVKNMVIEALKERETEDVLVAQFNSWQFANREQLTAAFFDQIGIALGRGTVGSERDRTRLLRRWRGYAAYLQAGGGLVELVRKPVMWGAGLLAVFLFGAAVAQAWWLALLIGVAVAAFAGLLKYSSRVAEKVAALVEVGVEVGRRSLEEVKRDLAESLRGLEAPVLVVIDDVDRLTPAEMQELFQLVKANADFPNLVYLLLFERGTVEKSIQKVLEVDGREYLEKIVQAGFDLPLVGRSQVDRVLFAGLDEVLELNEQIGRHFDQRRWENLYLGGLQPYFETLRDVNRYVSTFAFNAALFQSEGAFEVNPVDLIGLEVLRVFEPEVYHALPQHKEFLTRQRDVGGGDQEARRRALMGMVENAPEERRERVKEIVKQLFPPAEWAFGGMGYGAGFGDQWLRELRVCSSEVFDRYFRLTVPEEDISQATIDRIIGLAGDRGGLRAEFKNLASQGLLGNAMERLEAYKETMPIVHAQSFVTAVFDVGEDLPEARPGFFPIEAAMHATRIVYWYLRQEPDMGRRANVLRNAIRETEGVSLPVRFVAIQEQTAKNDRDRFVTDEALEELRQLCVLKIRAAAESGRLATNREFLGILYRWKEWAREDEPRAFCQSFAATLEGAVRLVTGFLQRSTSHSMGDYIAREHRFIRLIDVETFVAWEVIEHSLEAVAIDSLAPRERTAVEAFREAVERRRQGKPDLGDFGRREED